MSDLKTPYVVIRGALSAADMAFLRSTCKRHLEQERIPCYTLIDQLTSPTVTSIQNWLETMTGESVYYLNDFYIYTDDSFRSNWHMDTELFTLDRAVNAWILLSPDFVDDPLAFIDGVNESSDNIFHSVRIEADKCTFGNYRTGELAVRSLAEIESTKMHTPRVAVGDILLLNPKRFHRTNTAAPKHAIALKYVLRGKHGFLTQDQVDPHLWPEVELLNRLVKDGHTWDGVIDGIREALATDAGRVALSAGFYPEKFDLYRRMAARL